MGRSLKFDYDKALDRATGLFWKRGYAGTSLRALLQVMGIGEGSFYNTLKSKKQLYIECLDHYKNTVGRRRAEVLAAAPSASVGLRELYRALLDGLDDPRAPRACMISGSVSGDVLAEPDLKGCVSKYVAEITEDLARRLAADKEAGRLPADFDPKLVAEIINTYTQGIYQSALVHYDRPQFERQIDAFLKGLGL